MVTTNMRPIRETIGLNEALALINEATKPLERSERVVLSEAGGRVASRDVVSD